MTSSLRAEIGEFQLLARAFGVLLEVGSAHTSVVGARMMMAIDEGLVSSLHRLQRRATVFKGVRSVGKFSRACKKSADRASGRAATLLAKIRAKWAKKACPPDQIRRWKVIMTLCKAMVVTEGTQIPIERALQVVRELADKKGLDQVVEEGRVESRPGVGMRVAGLLPLLVPEAVKITTAPELGPEKLGGVKIPKSSMILSTNENAAQYKPLLEKRIRKLVSLWRHVAGEQVSK